MAEIEGMEFGHILHDMAQGTPTWAGGTAGALAGVLAAALVLKIDVLTHKDTDDRIMKQLLQFAEQESQIYPRILQTRRNLEEHKIQILTALNLSRDIARLSLQEAQTQLTRLSEVKKSLQADVITCAHLFSAAAASALTNIRANLALSAIDFPIDDLEDDLQALRKTLSALEHA